MKRLAFALVSTVVVSVASTALAEPVVRLEYSAPDACPAAADIQRRLETRRVRVSPGASVHAEITIVRRAASFEGTASTSTGVRRSLDDHSCESLADALALVVAIAVIDAQEATPPPRVVAAPSPVTATEPKPASFASFAVGVNVALAGAVAPRIAVGGIAFAELDPVRRGAFELSLRASIGAVSAGAVDVDPGAASSLPRASFTAVFGRIDLGGLRVDAGALELRLAASLGVGALRAEGLDVRLARTAWAPLVDLGPVARARYRLGPVALELGAALLFSLVRPRFFFAPNDTTVFEVPPVGALVFAGISLPRDFP